MFNFFMISCHFLVRFDWNLQNFVSFTFLLCSEGYFSLVSPVFAFKRPLIAYFVGIFTLETLSSFFILQLPYLEFPKTNKFYYCSKFFICFRQLREIQIKVKYRKINVFFGRFFLLINSIIVTNYIFHYILPYLPLYCVLPSFFCILAWKWNKNPKIRKNVSLIW